MKNIKDKLLLWLIYNRWNRMGKEFGKSITPQDYCIRRKVYEALMWEVRLNKY